MAQNAQLVKTPAEFPLTQVDFRLPFIYFDIAVRLWLKMLTILKVKKKDELCFVDGKCVFSLGYFLSYVWV